MLRTRNCRLIYLKWCCCAVRNCMLIYWKCNLCNLKKCFLPYTVFHSVNNEIKPSSNIFIYSVKLLRRNSFCQRAPTVCMELIKSECRAFTYFTHLCKKLTSLTILTHLTFVCHSYTYIHLYTITRHISHPPPRAESTFVRVHNVRSGSYNFLGFSALGLRYTIYYYIHKNDLCSGIFMYCDEHSRGEDSKIRSKIRSKIQL